jgi:3',5'-cyclic AMP phosphodiesterase CpdA
MFRLAHLSDPHIRDFSDLQLRDLLGKRAVGGLNLILFRRRKHRPELLQAMQADLRTRTVDHLAITGDLSNLSLESEWRAAVRWIEGLGWGPERITVIPGNHDTYVEQAVRSGGFERLFAPYQRADVRDVRSVDQTYPFVRLRGEVALVGVNTCVPTGDLAAWGQIGEAQLGRIERLLTAPELAGKTRVLLIHHPPVAHRPPENRNLRDRARLGALLARTGCELVLHGHDHRDEFAQLDGPAGAIPVFGVGSASYSGSPERRSRYNVYEIEGRTITAVTFAHDPATGRYLEAGRRTV